MRHWTTLAIGKTQLKERQYIFETIKNKVFYYNNRGRIGLDTKTVDSGEGPLTKISQIQMKTNKKTRIDK